MKSKISLFAFAAFSAAILCGAGGKETVMKDPCCAPAVAGTKPTAKYTSAFGIFGSAPIACKLTGAERQERGNSLKATLTPKIESVTELSDGYEFKLPGDADCVSAALKFVEEERRCCPFFKFEITFEPNEGPVLLRLKGSPEVKQFIRDHFVPAINASAKSTPKN